MYNEAVYCSACGEFVIGKGSGDNHDVIKCSKCGTSIEATRVILDISTANGIPDKRVYIDVEGKKYPLYVPDNLANDISVKCIRLYGEAINNVSAYFGVL